jgi:hypothetical protein
VVEAVVLDDETDNEEGCGAAALNEVSDATPGSPSPPAAVADLAAASTAATSSSLLMAASTFDAVPLKGDGKPPFVGFFVLL